MKKPGGFTLIEVLIALAVFAILATITSSAMYYAFTTRSRVAVQAERLNELQLAISLIERDTTQIVERAVRGNEMHIFPPFVGQPNYVEFTRGGIANPNALEKRSTLKRVALVCADNALVRRSWETLDTVKRELYEDKVLLDNMTSCQFAFLNHNLQILSQWAENALQLNQRKEPFPKAIQVNVVLKDWGNASFLFIIPEALYD